MSNPEMSELASFDSTDAKMIATIMSPFLVAGTAIATKAVVESKESNRPLSPSEQIVYGLDVGLPALPLIAVLVTAIRSRLFGPKNKF